MTTFVLVPGAGGQAWYWHRVVPRLAFRGHEAVAVELPAGDEQAGFDDYVRTVVGSVIHSTAFAAFPQTVVGSEIDCSYAAA